MTKARYNSGYVLRCKTPDGVQFMNDSNLSSWNLPTAMLTALVFKCDSEVDGPRQRAT
jgi:hypothetical protein